MERSNSQEQVTLLTVVRQGSYCIVSETRHRVANIHKVAVFSILEPGSEPEFGAGLKRVAGNTKNVSM